MYDKRLVSQSHFNNKKKSSNAFRNSGLLNEAENPREAEQYRVIDRAIDDSEVKRTAIIQTSVDPAIQSGEH